MRVVDDAAVQPRRVARPLTEVPVPPPAPVPVPSQVEAPPAVVAEPPVPVPDVPVPDVPDSFLLPPLPEIRPDAPVAICIATYSGAERLARLFRSFAAGGVADSDEILVYDDGSPAEEARALQAVCAEHHAAVRLVRSEENCGWTAGNAALVSASDASRPIILLLNDDVTLPDEFMTTLRALAASIGSVGALSWRSRSMHAGPTGHHSVRAIPGMLQPATHIAGYCMAFRRDVYDRVGGLDPRFRMYCSDSDLALRMTLAGHPSYRVWWPLVPHEEGAAFKVAQELPRPNALASQDLARWAEKWGGASAEEMEQRALTGLLERAGRAEGES